MAATEDVPAFPSRPQLVGGIMHSLESLRRAIVIVAAVLATAAVSNEASAQQRKFSFGYDQPHTTGYGIAADIFNPKLMGLSGGKFALDPFPRAPLRPPPPQLQHLPSP